MATYTLCIGEECKTKTNYAIEHDLETLKKSVETPKQSPPAKTLPREGNVNLLLEFTIIRNYANGGNKRNLEIGEVGKPTNK